MQFQHSTISAAMAHAARWRNQGDDTEEQRIARLLIDTHPLAATLADLDTTTPDSTQHPAA